MKKKKRVKLVEMVDISPNLDKMLDIVFVNGCISKT